MKKRPFTALRAFFPAIIFSIWLPAVFAGSLQEGCLKALKVTSVQGLEDSSDLQPIPEMSEMADDEESAKTPSVYGPTRPDLAKSVFNEGAPVERVVIVVHQTPSLQTNTARWLREEAQFEDAPRLLLATLEDYPIVEQELFREASLMLHSYGGEILAKLNTSEVHLAGGFCELCLSTALKHVIWKTIPTQESVQIHIWLEQSYSWEAFSGADEYLTMIQEATHGLKQVELSPRAPESSSSSIFQVDISMGSNVINPDERKKFVSVIFH